MVTFLVPVHATVVVHVCVQAEDKTDASAKAKAYWLQHYDNPEEPCFVEGQRIVGQFEIVESGIRKAEKPVTAKEEEEV